MGKILAMNWTEGGLRKIFNKIGKEDTERILESGRPRSVCTEENIEEVGQRICSHEELGTHEIPNDISRTMDIYKSSVHRIVKKDLDLCHLSLSTDKN